VQTKIEMRNALDLVRAHGGSVAAAARACGLPRETLRDWVRAARKKICCGK
jgi:transposase-like protein